MERERGVPIQEAALEGARQRFRAVMMTAISFIIGVFPMVIASGAVSYTHLDVYKRQSD